MNPQIKLLKQTYALEKLAVAKFPDEESRVKITNSGINSYAHTLHLVIDDYKQGRNQIDRYMLFREALSFIYTTNISNQSDCKYAIDKIVRTCKSDMSNHCWYYRDGYILENTRGLKKMYYAGRKRDEIKWVYDKNEAYTYFDSEDIKKIIDVSNLIGLTKLVEVDIEPIGREYISILEDWANNTYTK